MLRNDYLNHLWSWKDHTNVIKIITGMRRCGKSTLIMQYIEKLRESGVENIVYINFESKTADKIVDYKDLNDYFEKNIDSSNRVYIFLDEVQRVPGWERTLNSLSVDYDADVYVTGSNAYLLSSELSTYLSGRYVEIKMLPLSFREYIELHPANSENSIEKRFQDYLEKGAIPLIDPDDEDKKDPEESRPNTGLE